MPSVRKIAVENGMGVMMMRSNARLTGATPEGGASELKR